MGNALILMEAPLTICWSTGRKEKADPNRAAHLNEKEKSRVSLTTGGEGSGRWHAGWKVLGGFTGGLRFPESFF